MALSLEDFISKYTNQPVDFDGIYPNQCFDLAHQYIYDVLGVTDKKIIAHPGAFQIFTEFNANGIDALHFDKITNTPDGVPQKGDLIVWDQKVGTYGHVAIFIEGDAKTFKSFDANWPVGSLPHEEYHSYYGVLGWLHPKSAVIAQPIAQLNEQTKYDFGGDIGVQEMQAVRSIINDKTKTIKDQQIQLLLKQSKIDDLQRELLTCSCNFSNPVAKALLEIARGLG
jgi:hypothetical protein